MLTLKSYIENDEATGSLDVTHDTPGWVNSTIFGIRSESHRVSDTLNPLDNLERNSKAQYEKQKGNLSLSFQGNDRGAS